MTYEIIKWNYEKKLWNKQMVAIAVVKGVITDVQYKEITGEDYVAPTSIPTRRESTILTPRTAKPTCATVAKEGTL